MEAGERRRGRLTLMDESPPQAGPMDRGWIVSIHATKDDYTPLGTGVVIDEWRVLTCAHVAAQSPDELWAAFPMALDSDVRRRVVDRRADHRLVADVAVLGLDGPVPPGAGPARVKCPPASALQGHRWWALGFTGGSPLGNSAGGVVGEQLAYGWVRLDVQSRYVVEAGLSGGGVWSFDYGAVVGLVGQGNDRGDGQAITLHRADLCLPEEKLRALADAWDVAAAGEQALATWGWCLTKDPEAGRHWRPRSRGVSVESERGFRFRGRRRALTEIIDWLGHTTPNRNVLVVTGSPGVGKSAVLGRVVTTADPGIAAALPADDTEVRASVGSIACAVHAKGKTALDVAVEIARAASAQIPKTVDDLPAALRAALPQRSGGSGFNVVIDALDEATSPEAARAIVTRVILPLVETCADLGVQVVAGTRRRDDAGDLLTEFGQARSTINLDHPDYFAAEDLVAYTLATLQLLGDERPGNPYAGQDIAGPVAAKIAGLAVQNFLVAGLVARGHGLHDTGPALPQDISFVPNVDAVLREYLKRIPPVSGVPAEEVLSGLALAESPGLPLDLWSTATEALTGRKMSASELQQFAGRSAANFLIETSRQQGQPAYRLYHQALNDALIQGRAAEGHPRADDEQTLARSLLAYARTHGWSKSPPYLKRSLAGHAARGGIVDEILDDPDVLLHADLLRLIPLADQATTSAGKSRARLLHLTPCTFDATPPQRLALFTVTEALDHLETGFVGLDRPAPYRARWANTIPRREIACLDGHIGGVSGVCAVRVGGRQLLATAGADRTVRVWDPATGAERTCLTGHTGGVTGVCAVRAGGRDLLASASYDRTVRVWDPATGAEQTCLTGHNSGVSGVCAVRVGDRDLLASVSYDRTVRVWDPTTGEEQARLIGHISRVSGVCAVRVGGRDLLASAGYDRTVRVWDPATGAEPFRLHGHTDTVSGVCAVRVGDRDLLASASYDRTVRVWDPATGAKPFRVNGHTNWVSGVCAVRVDDQDLVASASADRTVRIWDPATGEEQARLIGHTGVVSAVCAVRVGARQLLASASWDQSVRVWDPAAKSELTPLLGHTDVVSRVCAVQVGDRDLLASVSADQTVRVWDPATGEEQAHVNDDTGRVSGVCAVKVGGRDLLASVSADHTVRVWDPATGAEQTRLTGHTDVVTDVCAVRVGDRELLASASWDRRVRVWDPATGAKQARLTGHTDVVTGVCAVRVGDRELLASASWDRTVRIWDPATGEPIRSIPVHHRAFGVVAIGEALIIALDRGILAIDLMGNECHRPSPS
jgi:WD40 repeat protein